MNVRRVALPCVLAVSSLGAFHCATNPSLGSGGGELGAGDDAGPQQQQEAGAEVGPLDGATPLSCAEILAQMLAAPITPPSSYAGLDLAHGQSPKGLSIDEANAAGCATMDPATGGGYRAAYFGPKESGIGVRYNMESKVVAGMTLGSDYTGTLLFRSRNGGSYGAHTYEIGKGKVLRDGADLPLDWANVRAASWEELFDAMMATFAPGTTSAANACTVGGACLLVPGDASTQAIFGVRPLKLYVQTTAGTNQVTGFYTFWAGGNADCSTPVAALEAMDDGAIVAGAVDVASGNVVAAPAFGNTDLGSAKPDGLTWQGADAINCNGKAVTSAEPAYGAVQWGPSGELTLEYNKTTNLAYRLIATAGYRGTLGGSDATSSYVVGIGTLTRDGAPFTIDWASPTATATVLTNALLGGTDADCVAAHTCEVTADDGQGHSILGLPGGLLTVMFAKGTSAPQSIAAVWPKGR